MTAPPSARFETLIYTDCRPGQGLQGTAGLQFQARSPDADREAMSVVQRSLLYEPPSSWMRARRPVAEYPRSFAHVADGLLATGAGVYLGREANGGREGNQLTHSVVARDPAAYRHVRPAQLFGAPFWRDEPAPSTECPPLTDDWEAGPIDAVAAQEFVRAEPDGAQRLSALLSALERVHAPDGRRVLFIAEEPDAVLHWLIAATLLMPQEHALRVGFKVFSTDPAYAVQPVVAVHPAWNSTSVRVGDDGGYVVFDLVDGGWTPVGADAHVRERVDLFVNEDPFDVVDIVELAAGTGIVDSRRAFGLGRAMMLPDRPVSDGDAEAEAEVAVAWLRDTPADLLGAHRGVLVDRLTSQVERWTLDTLRALDAVAVSGQVPADRVAPVRIALIRKELELAERTREVEAAPLPALPAGTWDATHQDEAQRLVDDTLRAGLPTETFEAVLRVAKRFGLSVDLEGLGEQANRFVDDWVGQPGLGYDPSAWPRGHEFKNILLEQLNLLVLRGYAHDVADRWWRRLIDEHRTPGSPLADAVLAAAMHGGSPAERAALTESVLRQATTATEPYSAVRAAAGALWGRHQPTTEELWRLCEMLPQGPPLPPEVFARFTNALRKSDPLRRDHLKLGRTLWRCGLFHPPEDLAALLHGDQRLGYLCDNLPSQPSRTMIAEYADDLRTYEDRLVRLHGDRLVEAMLAMRSPELVFEIVRALPDAVRGRYIDGLLRRADSGDPGIHLVTMFYLSGSLADPDAKFLDRRLVAAVSGMSDRRIKPLTSRVEKLGGSWPLLWTDVCERAKSAPRRRLWPLGGKS
ncbi:hypothetical protein Val02_52100 [Virgisporangium aliadipatigenens]|uniref:Uncharacterized protein n=1 Tax=Virgisporangium aliadipatigenens TaxID=741659 RepID=A0A8J4DS41_9ACTN|nr:GTPase-associated protein 1-related protein [Virgisporangium aliadipatigenens]GIJ48324.1 hypothetical protein Val02_52100 [Virgisporangium aliadipatigenens]